MALTTSTAENESRPGSQPLRVGLLLDSFEQPAWVHRAISEVIASGIARIVVVVIVPPLPAPPPSIWARIRHVSSFGLFDLYRQFDAYWFRDRRPDPFAIMNVEPLLPNARRLLVPATDSGAGELPEPIHREIEELDLDVVMRFGGPAPARGRPPLARFGVWTYDGDTRASSADAPGFWEVLTGNPVTRSALRVDAAEPEGRRPIYQSYASTVALSVWKNRRELYWKNAAFVARALRDVARRGASALVERHVGLRAHAPAVPPGNLRMLRLLPRLAARYATAQIQRRVTFDQWFVAYRLDHAASDDDSVPDTRLGDFVRMVPPNDRIWADPFPLVERGRRYIFIEELLFERNRGHISVVEVDDRGNATQPELVLRTENHLSYPFVFRWKGEIFMMPESARAGDNPAVAGNVSVPVFRSREFPHDWVQETVMLEGIEVFDPTLAEVDGRWWLFCTRAEPGASTWDELHLFYGPTPFGPWTPHPGNPVKSDVRSARPAGRLYTHGGHWYRPAQNCSVRYGYGISINRIECLTTTEYREVEVQAILPTWAPGLIGTHTLNAAGGLSVTDGRLRRSRWGRP